MDNNYWIWPKHSTQSHRTSDNEIRLLCEYRRYFQKWTKGQSTWEWCKMKSVRNKGKGRPLPLSPLACRWLFQTWEQSQRATLGCAHSLQSWDCRGHASVSGHKRSPLQGLPSFFGCKPAIRPGSSFMPNPGTMELREVLTFLTQAFGKKIDPKLCNTSNFC